ncbi:phenylalanine--tRNA ligase subunit alpha, partial [Candidatus Gracilibacteria bacterium]|nr:phenylalanine--tRNA ligase subunit alpha [Candidatus Gracilibacteria bacterium]
MNPESLKPQIQAGIAALTSLKQLIEYRNSLVGKKGTLTEMLKNVASLSPEEKKTLGKSLNELRADVEAELAKKEKEIRENELKTAENRFIDMTVPTPSQGRTQHPIKIIQSEIIDIVTRMGFSVWRSPTVTTEFDNFDALNIPSWHPARDMQDTFWLTDKRVLATQTSCMQNHLLKTQPKPLRAMVLGSVYRNEKIDATHDIAFEQVEGLVVDKNITIGHLKGTITTILTELFGYEPKFRMRPGYFPFVEPGMEVDLWWEKDGKGRWLEFMGCGLVHPNVLKQADIDPEVYSGFAFGFGLTRLAMIRYGISDIRLFHENKIEFLEQFTV